MSIEKREIITCPDCGKDGEFVIWESLNTQLDPEAKKDLLSGAIFKYECPHCKSVHNVDYGMLYHQMEKHIMVQYSTTDENAQEGIETFENMRNQGLEGFPAMDADYVFRIVRSQNQLREKAFIFDQGLDDRVIEMMKLFMRIHLSKANPELEIEEMFLEIAEDGPESFAIRLADGHWGSTDFAQDMYDSIYNDFFKDVDENRSYIVDANWAISILQSRKG